MPLLGEIKLFSGDFIPQGYMYANGAELSIHQNRALFSLYGTTYGGDGVSTFKIPDLTGRIPVHYGTGDGLTEVTLGDASGEEKVVLSNTEIAHRHDIRSGPSGGLPTTDKPENNLFSSEITAFSIFHTALPTADLVSDTLDFSGEANPIGHNNLQPFLALIYIVCISGDAPEIP